MDPVEFRVGSEVLHGEHWAPTGAPKGALVLVHGFNSSLEEFGKAPQWLAEAGYHVLAFDQRGFGQSAGERGRTHVDRAVPDIAAAAAALQTLAGPGVPLGVVGHSLGGAYATAAVGRRAVDAQALVLAHPVDRLFDEVPVPLRGAYHLLGKFAERRMAKGKSPGALRYRSRSKMLFVSLQAAREAGRPDFLLRHSNLGNYQAAITMSTTQWARDVKVPVLVVTSPHDRVVKPAHIRAVYDAFAAPKRLFTQDGGHSCFRDLDGRRLVDEMAAWFGAHLRGQT
ncbi:MAG: alpha/beta fold hydrolase [Candidatus Thermoplasmatota archaeon]